jgi:putative endonuclease
VPSPFNTKTAHLFRGKNAEDQAHDFLIGKGLIPVDRNYRCKQGELDLVMRDRDSLVFVEVRYRKSDTYGSALESVTSAKQQRIIAAAPHYLSRTHLNPALRFDVVAISGDGTVNWIKNEF